MAIILFLSMVIHMYYFSHDISYDSWWSHYQIRIKHFYMKIRNISEPKQNSFSGLSVREDKIDIIFYSVKYS